MVDLGSGRAKTVKNDQKSMKNESQKAKMINFQWFWGPWEGPRPEVLEARGSLEEGSGGLGALQGSILGSGGVDFGSKCLSEANLGPKIDQKVEFSLFFHLLEASRSRFEGPGGTLRGRGRETTSRRGQISDLGGSRRVRPRV